MKYMAKNTAVVLLPDGNRRAIRVGRLYDSEADPQIQTVVELHPQFFDRLEPIAGTETATADKRQTSIPFPDGEAPVKKAARKPKGDS